MLNCKPAIAIIVKLWYNTYQMKRDISNYQDYVARAYDYTSPKLGRLNVFYQQKLVDFGVDSDTDNENGISVHSRVFITPEINDKNGFNDLACISPRTIPSDRYPANKRLLSIAGFTRDTKPSFVDLDWLETYEGARKHGLGRLAMCTGINEADLDDDELIYADFLSHTPGWNSKVDAFNKMQFNRVPPRIGVVHIPSEKKKQQSFQSKANFNMIMTIKAGKALKNFDASALKPNERLTDYMLERGQLF